MIKKHQNIIMRISLALLLPMIVYDITLSWNYIPALKSGMIFYAIVFYLFYFLFIIQDSKEKKGTWKDHNRQTRCTRCAGIIEDE